MTTSNLLERCDVTGCAVERSVVADRRQVKRQRAAVLSSLESVLPTCGESQPMSAEGVSLLRRLAEIGSRPGGPLSRILGYRTFAERLGVSVGEMAEVAAMSFGATASGESAVISPELMAQALALIVRRRYGSHVDVAIPGGGKFRIEATAAAVGAFAAHVKRRLGREASGAGFRIPSTPKSSPTEAPKLRTVSDVGAVRDALAINIVEDRQEQPELAHILTQDGLSVSTDGCRLTVVRGDVGEPNDEILRRAQRKFPAWRRVLPAGVEVDSGAIRVSAQASVVVDSEELFKIATRAETTLGERNRWIRLHICEGRVLASTAPISDEFGADAEFSMDGATDANLVTTLPVDHVLDIARQARLLGMSEVRMFACKNNKVPVVFLFGDIGLSLVMPMSR